MRLKTTSVVIAAGIAFSFSGTAAKAAAPATAQGYINFRTYAGDQRSAIRSRTAVPDGSFYPLHAEGPYNGYPGADAGVDDAPPGDLRNNYNMELIGYFYPPKTGKIQFAISSDDPGELWFSTDDDPSHKDRIATESQWNPVRAFGGAWDGSSTATRRSIITVGDAPTPRPENWSAFIQVTQGKPYFIQGIATEFGGGDNIAIAFRYDTDAEFADNDVPIGKANLSPFYPPPTTAVILLQPADAAVYAGGTAAFSVGVDSGPTGTITSTKWQKNGVDIPDSDTLNLSFPVTAADDGAKIKAIVTTSTGTVTSTEATLIVGTLATDFTVGVVKLEVWIGISGTAVSALLDDAHYQDPSDDLRLLGSIDSPNGYGDNYGARISGFIIPPDTANYDFFIRSDDASQLYLSKDETPPVPGTDTPIAEETGCCNAFLEPGASQTTAAPISLQAGKKYAFIALVKEGGGGDFLQVAIRKEGDTTAAGALTPISGTRIGANVKPNKGDPQITKQPQFPAQLEEGKSYRFAVDGVVTPTAFNYPLLVQWQKNGANIPGATGKSYKIASAAAGDAGTYRAVVGTLSGKTVNSVESPALAVVPDTFAPVPTAGALLKGGKQEIGVGFDEEVTLATANVLANYSLGAGTIDSIRVVKREATGFDASYNMKEYNGIVLVASGLTAGQTYQLTVKNVADPKGNAIPAAGVSVSFKAEGDKTWSVVGANDSKFVNDVIRSADGSFDVVSGGVAFWADYDEATFVNQKVTGDFDAKVQVFEQDPSSQWARTGLMAREALDEGKARLDRTACPDGPLIDGVFCMPQAQLFSRLQTVHANAPAVWNNSVGSNNSYENHWRAEDTYARLAPFWDNQMNSADGGFAPLDYPNVWARLKREGPFLNTYRSVDGETWNIMTSRYFPKLAEAIYIGPFYGPELANNAGWTAADPAAGIGHSVLAKFRNYSITAGTPPVGNEPTISIARDATTIRITYTGTLLGADSVTGPYAAVQGATSPYTVTPTGSATFFKAGQ